MGYLVMIIDIHDVQTLMANRCMRIFKGMMVKELQQTMECINFEGSYVNCVEVDDNDYMEVDLQEQKIN